MHHEINLQVPYGKADEGYRTGCSEVKSFAFNHRTAPANDYGKAFAGYQGTQGPAKRLHVDSTPTGAAHMIDHMWPEEAEDIKKRGKPT